MCRPHGLVVYDVALRVRGPGFDSRCDRLAAGISIKPYSSVSIQIDTIEGLFLEGYAVGRKPPKKEQAKSNQRDAYRQ